MNDLTFDNKSLPPVDKKKLDKYLELLKDEKLLINASQSLVTKRQSPMARSIKNGNVKMILKAARDKINGTLDKEKRRKLCRVLCEFENKVKACETRKDASDIIATLIAYVISFFTNPGSLLIAIIWIIRRKFYFLICKCNFDKSAYVSPEQCHNFA